MRVDHAERDGVRRAELVVDQLLGVEIVDPLILSGVAAVSKALADRLEGLLDALAEVAREDRRLGRAVVCKFAGLGADLDDLALLDDDHALTVGDGDAGTVRYDVVALLLCWTSVRPTAFVPW